VTGGLAVGSKYATGAANMGLPANLYNWLKYDATKGTVGHLQRDDGRGRLQIPSRSRHCRISSLECWCATAAA
jgi:hypothetical protein